MARFAHDKARSQDVSWVPAPATRASARTQALRRRLLQPFNLGFMVGMLIFCGLAGVQVVPVQSLEPVSAGFDRAGTLAVLVDLNWTSEHGQRDAWSRPSGAPSTADIRL